jgi:2-polyprenyl-6-hydroxyphenyl methylase/3-demethylubiquinone-9 3-methyltransferase
LTSESTTFVNADAPEYRYASAHATWADAEVFAQLTRRLRADPSISRVLDAGCGNGSLAARVAALGYEVVGFDPSASGIEHARRGYPTVRFHHASGYGDLYELGQFDACMSVEVIEHVYDPRQFARGLFDALRPGGLLLVSTPYHGYLKNVALAITGRMDDHFTALWDGGHIKFWSRRTLTQLLVECGFQDVQFEGIGRLPLLWKSMLLSARKPIA